MRKKPLFLRNQTLKFKDNSKYSKNRAEKKLFGPTRPWIWILMTPISFSLKQQKLLLLSKKRNILVNLFSNFSPPRVQNLRPNCLLWTRQKVGVVSLKSRVNLSLWWLNILASDCPASCSQTDIHSSSLCQLNCAISTNNAKLCSFNKAKLLSN